MADQVEFLRRFVARAGETGWSLDTLLDASDEELAEIAELRLDDDPFGPPPTWLHMDGTEEGSSRRLPVRRVKPMSLPSIRIGDTALLAVARVAGVLGGVLATVGLFVGMLTSDMSDPDDFGDTRLWWAGCAILLVSAVAWTVRYLGSSPYGGVTGAMRVRRQVEKAVDWARGR